MKFKRVALYLALGSATGHAFDPVLKGGSVVLSDNNATLRTDLAERSLDSAMKVFLKGILETVLQGRTVVEGLTCTICRELLVGLKGLAASGNEAVSDGLEKMCSIVMVAAEVHLISFDAKNTSNKI
ncbi:hypothetical protein CRV24_005137 [Beauveria bassiana]|nr:hypothetical protein CRV24_005137 [Beauveria bassiana]